MEGRFPFDELVKFCETGEIDKALDESKDGTTVKPVVRFSEVLILLPSSSESPVQQVDSRDDNRRGEYDVRVGADPVLDCGPVGTERVAGCDEDGVPHGGADGGEDGEPEQRHPGDAGRDETTLRAPGTTRAPRTTRSPCLANQPSTRSRSSSFTRSRFP